MCCTTRKASGLQWSQHDWLWCVLSAAWRNLGTFLYWGGGSEPALEQSGYRGVTGCFECHILSWKRVFNPPHCFLHVAGSLRQVLPSPYCYQLNFMPPYHTRTDVYQHCYLVVPGPGKQDSSTTVHTEQAVWFQWKTRGWLLPRKTKGLFALQQQGTWCLLHMQFSVGDSWALASNLML